MFQKKNIILLVFCLCLIGSINAKMMMASWATQQTLEASIYVNEGPNLFYFYQVFSDNGNIIIEITDQNINNYTLPFDKANNLYFRAAYYKFIIVQQKNQTDTLNYWVLQIQKTQIGFDLKSFSVNSRIDDQGFPLDNDYLLASIIEYNQFDNFLYVIMQAENDTDIYGFDLTNQGSAIKIINWFYLNKQNPEFIAGGNARVLIQATNDQLWMDTRNVRVNTTTDATIYNKTNIKDLTYEPIYPNGSKVYNLLNSYFEYVSQSQDSLKLSAFVYHGYGDQPIEGEANLVSSVKIKTFADGYNFFMAIGDQDIYLTVIGWNQTIKNYTVYSNTLKNSVMDHNQVTATIKIFSQAIWVVYNDDKLYVLTADKFYVYGGDTYFTKLYQLNLVTPVTQKSNIVDVMFEEILVYQYLK